MKKTYYLAMMLCAMILLLAANSALSEDAMLAADVDGAIWMQSSSDEKRAFLYGAGSAFVLEYYIRTKHDEKPSKFIQGWVDVFKDQTWSQVEMAVNEYYMKNPDKMNEHVFHAMWYNMIKPNLKD